MRVHVIAGGDRPAGEADDLAVAAHRLSLGDRSGRDLVAGRDMALGGDALARDRGALQDVGAGDDDGIGRIEPDGQGRLGHLLDPLFLERGDGQRLLAAEERVLAPLEEVFRVADELGEDVRYSGVILPGVRGMQ